MKKLLTGLAMCGLSVAAMADNQFSLGVGYPYAGLGAKYSMSISEQTYIYGSLGVAGYSDSDGEAYGYGAGMDIAVSDNSRHVVNLLFVGENWNKTNSKDFRGYGLGYSYHGQGLGQSGWSFGTQILQRNYAEAQACCTGDHSTIDDDITLGLSAGYSF
jgi:hypothetical protein